MNENFLYRTLQLATLGRGKVGNGALVGAVLVRDGVIIAEAFHTGFGKPHAERLLLENFDQEIRSNDVLYVNLEPCCHHGKTPPCTEIILNRGIKKVVYGIGDPDPRVSGRGIGILRSKGVDVEGHVLRASCERLNRGFLAVRRKSRPWITLKMAKARDGKIANSDGSPLKITSDEQDVWSHAYLRSQSDAILVGVGTVEKDDPQLTIRYAKNDDMNIEKSLIKNKKSEYMDIDHPQPWRIILDPQLRIPLESKVVTDALRDRTIIITSDDALPQASTLRAREVKIFNVPSTDGHFAWDALWKTLTTPVDGFDGLMSILVEGGERTWKIFRDAGMVDEEVVLVGE